MLRTNLDVIGDISVIECDGKIGTNQAASRLKEAVTAQSHSRTIVLDLSEVESINPDGLSILVFLQRWAHDQGIQLKLFNPSRSVRSRLETASSIYEFDLPTLQETMALLIQAENKQAAEACYNAVAA